MSQRLTQIVRIGYGGGAGRLFVEGPRYLNCEYYNVHELAGKDSETLPQRRLTEIFVQEVRRDRAVVEWERELRQRKTIP